MMRVRRSLPLFVLLLTVGYVAASNGQELINDGDSAYQPEELVEIEVLGEWVPGQIVKETAEESGSYRVKFQYKGRRIERNYPVSKIRRATETPVTPLSQLRNWSDTSGKHSVLARLIEVTDNVAVLMKQDGSQVRVDMEKLSMSDRLFARRMALRAKEKEKAEELSEGRLEGPVADGRRRRPAEGRAPVTVAEPSAPDFADGGHADEPLADEGLSDEELAAALGADEPRAASPSETEMHGSGAARAEAPESAASPSAASPLGNLAALGAELFKGTADSSATPGTTASNEIGMANVQTITVDPNKGWSLAPEPTFGSSRDDLVYDLPSLGVGTVVDMNLAVAATANHAVALFTRDAGEPIVAKVSLAKENSATLLPAADLQQVLDINPDGQRVIGRAQASDGKPALGVWGLRADAVAREATLLTPSWNAVHRASWFDEMQVLVHVDDQVALVQFDAAWSAHVRYLIAGVTAMSVSPTRNHVAIQKADGILLLAAATGDQVGWIPMASPPTAMAFSPEGLYLFTASAEGLAQWDLASGAQQILVPMPRDVSRLDCLTSDFVLVNAAELVRISSQETVRTFQTQSPLIEKTMTAVGGALWFLVPPTASAPPQIVHLALMPTELESRQANPVNAWTLGRGGRRPLVGGDAQRH